MAEIKQFEDLPDGIANDDSNSFQQAFADYQAQGEEYVRANPTQSVLWAVAAGFVLRLLPLGAIIGALIRLALFAVRPAIFIYGAVMLYKHYQSTNDQPQ
jgi:hypothetical protein